MGDVTATVEVVRGEFVMRDDVAPAVIGATACVNLLAANSERVEHFARRIVERGDDASEVVIAVLNVNDPHGAEIADMLMPGHDWQSIRDRGETPVARGLASVALVDLAEAITKGSRAAFDAIDHTTHAAVVVVDCGVAVVANSPLPRVGR